MRVISQLLEVNEDIHKILNDFSINNDAYGKKTLN
jgi:hypothetical protein